MVASRRIADPKLGDIPAKAGTWWEAAALVEVEGSHWVPAFAHTR